jgi:hypothetical protein
VESGVAAVNQRSHEVNCRDIIGVTSQVNFGIRRIEFRLGHGARRVLLFSFVTLHRD